MQAYSLDLRLRVVRAVERHEGSLRAIARRFQVSLSFVYRLVQRHRRTGHLGPRPHGGGRRPALDAAAQARLRQAVAAQPDATLDELAARVGVGCSRTAIFRALRKLGITRKKKVLHAQERDRPDVQRRRQAFRARMRGIAPERLHFVDESGATTAMTRTYGRAPRGERVEGAVPGQWGSVTWISELSLSGVGPALAFAGAADAAAVQTYVDELLAPGLKPGDVVVWDNLQAHKSAAVVQSVEASGAEVVSLPPYSPDLNPIEKMFSKAKEFLRGAAARTTAAVYTALGDALTAVCPDDIRGWFQSCGLCVGQT